MRKFKPEVFYQATMPNDVDDYQLINYGKAFVSHSSRQNNLKNKENIKSLGMPLSLAAGFRAFTVHS